MTDTLAALLERATNLLAETTVLVKEIKTLAEQDGPVIAIHDGDMFTGSGGNYL